VLTIDRKLLNSNKITNLSYNESPKRLYYKLISLQLVLIRRFLSVKGNKEMKKKSQERQMIVFENLRKYVSIVGTKYRVLGL
jgi:hypothetical protein